MLIPRLMQLEEAVKEQVKVPSHSPQSENLQDETNMGEKRHKRATRYIIDIY